MTQKETILNYLKDFGPLTTYDAFIELGVTKLTTRISELRRDGYDIQAEKIITTNRFGKKTYFFRYELFDDGTGIHGDERI